MVTTPDSDPDVEPNPAQSKLQKRKKGKEVAEESYIAKKGRTGKPKMCSFFFQGTS